MAERLNIIAADNAAALVVNLQASPQPDRVFYRVAGFFSQLVGDSFNAELGADHHSVRACTSALMHYVRTQLQAQPPVNRTLFGNAENVINAAMNMRDFARQPQHLGAVFFKGYKLLRLAYNDIRGTTADPDALQDVMYRLEQLVDPVSPAQEIPEDWE